MDRKKQVNYYIYKGVMYEEPPIRFWAVTDIDTSNTGYIKTFIRNELYEILAIIFFVILIVCSTAFVTWSKYSHNYYNIGNHIIRVPSEMFYDSDSKVLDIDITNDSSNFETVGLSVSDKNDNPIVSVKDINPGESVGGIVISKELTELPIEGYVNYMIYNKDSGYSVITKKVLIVDRHVSDSIVNKEF